MNCFAIILLVLCWICSCPVAVDITDVDDYDPGSCDKSNVLNVYSVNDRNNKKKLWICIYENNKYLWKPVDGDSYLGEFLSPGYDCSDIIDHEADASDGFYWITLGTDTKRKVWCDMKTDGGGYALIARKHDAITWDIPSKDETVDPKSVDTFWTSQLGDAPILDFRVQFADSDSFDATKAHWSFRLQQKRNLSELMITDRGCSVLEPGIGDIAYVKDHLTNTIASTTFECSVFGGMQTSGQLGWSMMNECLKSSCGGSGYFHFQGLPLAVLDHTGVFSYSASGRTSGLGNGATASMGCVNKQCCGCYGPVGGKGNYCNSQCDSADGGNIILAKNIYTWVWVRSSIPKRIWDRCIEYQSEDDHGQLQWYTIVDDSGIPEKGRCSNGVKLRLNSGVLVVPDNETAEIVPGSPGQLEFRTDTKKLYLRANKTWSVLPQEKELTQIKESLKQELSTVLKLEKNLSYVIPNYNRLVEVGKRYPQCIRYQRLSDASRRYGNYDSSDAKCDSHLSGWYRFEGAAGTKMRESCTNSYYYCGTHVPGYLNGAHPSQDDGMVSRTVCFYYDNNCCFWTHSINVINCAGLYYVYELNGTPGCSFRYCST